MKRYRYLLRYAAPHWRGWTLILGITLLSTSFSLLQPWPMKILVDHVLEQKPMADGLARGLALLPGADGPYGLLAWVIVAGLAIFALNSALDVIQTRAWITTGQRMVYDLAADLFARLQRRSLLFHSRNAVGDSMSRITGDSWCVNTVFFTLLFTPGQALFALTGMVVVMARMDRGLFLLSLAVAPFLTGSSLLFGRPLRAAARARREIESRIQSHIQQTLSGLPVVKAFTREDQVQRRFREFTADAIRAQQRSTLTGSLYDLSSGLITTLGTAVVLWIGARHVLEGSLTLGGLLVFLSYLVSLQGQMRALTGIYTALQGAGAGVDRVMEVLEAEPEVTERPGARRLTLDAEGQRSTLDARRSAATTADRTSFVPVERRASSVERRALETGLSVRFDHVTFGYEPHRPVLRDVSLLALPGQTLALVGPTGAGKSTLVSLIPRFFDPWEGRVYVGEHDVRDVQLRSLRDQVALVLQEPFLFPVSIAENIAYGRPEATPEEIEGAARAANAHAFIARLPEGYQTAVGERGATLSGGERQRIAIARALLKDAPILILDEPTSALDAETEGLLLEALERLMAGRTTFIIAHRLSTIRGADRIVVIEEGRVAEEGRHGELLGRGGLYARLHSRQFGVTAAVPVGAAP